MSRLGLLEVAAALAVGVVVAAIVISQSGAEDEIFNARSVPSTPQGSFLR